MRRPEPCPRGSSSPPSPPQAVLGLVGVYFGVVLLIAAWALLGTVVRGPEPPTPRSLLLVLAVWAAPLLLAPPLFSRDVYSYLAQGAMVDAHIDVYAHGPGAARRAARRRGGAGVAAEHDAVRPGLPRRRLRAVRAHPRGGPGRTARHAAGRPARRRADGGGAAPARPAQRSRSGRRAVAGRAQPARPAAPGRRCAQRRHHARAARRRTGGGARPVARRGRRPHHPRRAGQGARRARPAGGRRAARAARGWCGPP